MGAARVDACVTCWGLSLVEVAAGSSGGSALERDRLRLDLRRGKGSWGWALPWEERVLGILWVFDLRHKPEMMGHNWALIT